MKIVAFLQNQWVRNPAKLKKILDKNPDIRPTLNKYLLFAGCLTGKRLKSTLNGWVDKILWEEASKEIGSFASSKFKPDLNHMKEVIEKYKPEVVICLGSVSTQAFKNIKYEGKVLNAAHPVAKKKGIMDDLRNIKLELDNHFKNV